MPEIDRHAPRPGRRFAGNAIARFCHRLLLGGQPTLAAPTASRRRRRRAPQIHRGWPKGKSRKPRASNGASNGAKAATVDTKLAERRAREYESRRAKRAAARAAKAAAKAAVKTAVKADTNGAGRDADAKALLSALTRPRSGRPLQERARNQRQRACRRSRDGGTAVGARRKAVAAGASVGRRGARGWAATSPYAKMLFTP